MALTLLESAVLSQDMRQRGIMETIATSSTVLDRLPFETIEGNAFRYVKEATLPGAEFRAVNAAYAESTGTFSDATESLSILGGDADVDRFIQQTRSNLEDQLAAQVFAKSKSVQAKFSDTFVNGDTAVDANSYNGLKKRITGAQHITSGANGAAINTDQATRFAFFGRLLELISLVPDVQIMYANSQVIHQFRIAAMRETMAQQTVDSLGRTVDVFAGVPFVDIGKKADGTNIIPQTEVAGTATNTSSIYAVNFAGGLAEPGVVGLQNGDIQVDSPRQLETKPSWRVRLEWYCGLALFGNQPAARLSGVIAA